jgi:hypothetical protein
MVTDEQVTRLLRFVEAAVVGKDSGSDGGYGAHGREDGEEVWAAWVDSEQGRPSEWTWRTRAGHFVDGNEAGTALPPYSQSP